MDNYFGENACDSGLEFLDSRIDSNVEISPNSMKECHLIIKQLFKKIHFFATDLHETEMQRRKLENALNISNNENKRLCTDYSSTLKTLSETETALELCQEKCKEFKKREALAEINNEAFQSHSNQLQSLIKLQERTIEENKGKLKKYELELLDMRKDIYYLVYTWKPKNKTPKRLKAIQQKYPKSKKNKEHEKFEENSDDDDFDSIDIPLVVSGKRILERKLQSNIDNNKDHIMEFDSENGRIPSEDTGRASSIFSDLDTCYQGSPYPGDSPLSIKDDNLFVDRATSPIRESLVDIGTNTTYDMSVSNITNEKRSLIDRSTSPTRESLIDIGTNTTDDMNVFNITNEERSLIDRSTSPTRESLIDIGTNTTDDMNVFNITNEERSLIDRSTSPTRESLIDIGTNTTDDMSVFNITNEDRSLIDRSISPISLHLSNEQVSPLYVYNKQAKQLKDQETNTFHLLINRATSPIYNLNENFACATEKDRKQLLDIGTNTTDDLSGFSSTNKESMSHVDLSTSPKSLLSDVCIETNTLTVVDYSNPINDIFDSPLRFTNKAKTSFVDCCTSPIKNTRECLFNLSNKKLLDRASSPVKILTPTRHFADASTNTEDLPVDGFVRYLVCDRCKSIFNSKEDVLPPGKEKIKPVKGLVINVSNTADFDDVEHEIQAIFSEMRIGFDLLSPIPPTPEILNSPDIFLSLTATEIHEGQPVETLQTKNILENRTEALENLSKRVDNLDSSITPIGTREIVERPLNGELILKNRITLSESQRLNNKFIQKSKIKQDNNNHQKQILHTGLRSLNKETKLTQAEIEASRKKAVAIIAEFSKGKSNSKKQITPMVDLLNNENTNVLNITQINNADINVVEKDTSDVFVASTSSEIIERQSEKTLQAEKVLENRTEALEALSKTVSNLENQSGKDDQLKESKKNNKKLTKLQRFKNKCTPKGKIKEDNNNQNSKLHMCLRSINKEKKLTQSEVEASRKKAVALIAEFSKGKSYSKNLVSPIIDTASTIAKNINITNADTVVENQTVTEPQRRTQKRNSSVTITEIPCKRVLRSSNSKLGCDNNLIISEDGNEYKQEKEKNHCKENSPTNRQTRNRNNSINSSPKTSVTIEKSTRCLRSSRNKSNDENENIEKVNAVSVNLNLTKTNIISEKTVSHSNKKDQNKNLHLTSPKKQNKTLFENNNGEMNIVAFGGLKNSPTKQTKKRTISSNSTSISSATIRKSTRCLHSSENKSNDANEESAKIYADSASFTRTNKNVDIVSEEILSKSNKTDQNASINSQTHQTKPNKTIFENESVGGNIVSYGDLDMFSIGEASSKTEDDPISLKENDRRNLKHFQSPKNCHASVDQRNYLMGDRLRVMIQPLELMRNVKKPNVNTPCRILRTMIEKYVEIKPRKVKKKEDTDETNTLLGDLLEERITLIIEQTTTIDQSERVKRQLDQLTVDLSHSTCDDVIAGVVKYLMNPQRKMEMFNKIFTPPAPAMTKAEQMLLYVLLELRTHWPTTDVISILMKKIEQSLFQLNASPSFEATESLSHFYAILCRYCGNVSRLRSFIMDAMYCIQFKSLCVIKQCLDVEPHVLPRAHHHLAKNTLVVGLVYLMHFYKCNDKYGRMDAIRNMLNKKYFYEFTEWNERRIMDLIRKAIEQLRDNELERKMLARMLVLFGKRLGNDWCYNNIIKRTLDPIIKDQNVGESVRCFCISTIGALVKPFNLGSMNLQINCVLTTLTKMLCQRQTPRVEEAIVASLIYISRHNEVKVSRVLLCWEPQTQVSQELHERLKLYVKQKTLKAWKYLLTKECEV